MKKNSLFTYAALQFMVAVYACAGIFSKLAARYSFLSLKFCMFYALMIAALFVYAIGWQQVIKRVELTAAYSAKAAAVIWGLIWGAVIFHERITLPKIAGIILVFAGLLIYFTGDGQREDDTA